MRVEVFRQNAKVLSYDNVRETRIGDLFYILIKTNGNVIKIRLDDITQVMENKED